MELSFVLPAYNEEKRIARTIHAIDEFVQLQDKITTYEIIVVDDGSKDKTIEKVGTNPHTIILRNSKNQGKGYSVKRGVLAAKYEYVLFMDCDLATPIDEFNKLYSVLERGYDLAIASRNLRKSHIVVRQPYYRQIAGKIFPLLVRLFFSMRLKDTQCGFKLFRKEVAEQIFPHLRIKRFAFDVEMLFIATQMKYSIAEVPVMWIDQRGSKVRVVRDSYRMFKDLARIKLNQLKGKYSFARHRKSI